MNLWWCGYSQGLWVPFVTTDQFWVRVAKINSKGLCLMNSQPGLWFLPLFGLMKWLCYQKYMNQITLNHRTLNIQCLCSNFIWRSVTLFLNQTLLIILLYVKQTWVNQLILLISLWGVIFLWSKRILLLICIDLQFM